MRWKTCSVCERNVKLKAGKIVDHGYTIKYGFQSGNCAGVGYDPIEISYKGTLAYVRTLEAYKVAQEKALPKAQAEYAALVLADKIEFDRSREARAVRNAPRSLETDIRYAGKDIEWFTKIIAEWAVKPLPAAA